MWRSLTTLRDRGSEMSGAAHRVAAFWNDGGFEHSAVYLSVYQSECTLAIGQSSSRTPPRADSSLGPVSRRPRRLRWGARVGHGPARDSGARLLAPGLQEIASLEHCRRLHGGRLACVQIGASVVEELDDR